MRKCLSIVLSAGLLGFLGSPGGTTPRPVGPKASYLYPGSTTRSIKAPGRLHRPLRGVYGSGTIWLPFFRVFSWPWPSRWPGRWIGPLRGFGWHHGRGHLAAGSSHDFMRGLVIGDYYVLPTFVFSTDNRYDNASSREYVLRQERDLIEAHKRGEIPFQDPLTALIDSRGSQADPRDSGFVTAQQIERDLHAISRGNDSAGSAQGMGSSAQKGLSGKGSGPRPTTARGGTWMLGTQPRSPGSQE